MQSARHSSWKMKAILGRFVYSRREAGSQNPWIKPRLQHKAFSPTQSSRTLPGLGFFICEMGILIVHDCRLLRDLTETGTRSTEPGTGSALRRW